MRLVLGGIVLGAAGCVIPYAVPPLKADVGAATPVALDAMPGRTGTAFHAAVGVSAASGTTNTDVPFDVGAGALVESSGQGATARGGYVEGTAFVHRRGTTRVGVGMRVEVRHTALGLATATKARLDAEVIAPGDGAFEGQDRCGATVGRFRGAAGIGLYAEAGPAWSPEGAAFVASAGVTVRIPGAVGVYLGIPWCR